MSKTERLRNNLITVYYCIKGGANTIDKLLSSTQISQYHLTNALFALKELEIIEEGTENNKKQCRHPKTYNITNKYHTTYIERHEPNFAVISISSLNKCVATTGFPTLFSAFNPSNTFDFFTRGIKRNKIYKYCNKIYLLADNTEDIITSDNIERISRLDLIASSLTPSNEPVILDYYGDKYIISEGSYKLLEASDSAISDINKQIIVNEENIYDQIFEALARHTDIYIEKLLNNY